jgi:catechol 2,3-dioxygenase-like lactoylglutathione lyase family enzyme
MPFLAIDHPAIACQDVNLVAQWYCRHLGMRVIANDGKTPPSMLVGYDRDVRGGAVIELMPARDAGPAPETFKRFQPGLRHLALRVDDFDQTYERLKQLGVRFVMEPGQALAGGKIVSFLDPEGNELQIVERKI